MTNSNLFKTNIHLFTEKYPHYSYLGWEHFFNASLPKKKKKYSFASPQVSPETNCLIFCGLEGEDILPFLHEWLFHHRNRKVLLVLKSFQEFLVFCMNHPLKELLHFQQIEWMILSQENEEKTLSDWLFSHDYYRIEMVYNFYSASAKKEYFPLVEKIKPIIHLLYMRQIDQIFFEKNLMNYLKNLCYLPKSGFINEWKDSCKNVPAIICGAGSSLEKDKDLIKKSQNQAVIISTGSGFLALHQQGIHPHLAFATDPTIEEKKRFHDFASTDTILVYTHRLHHDVLKKAKHSAYLFSGLEKGFDDWMKKEFSFIEPFSFNDKQTMCFSSSILALSLAVFLGCNPIIFSGLDLSYLHNQRYVPGILDNNILENQSNLILKKDINHQPVYTKLEFLLEQQSLASCIQQYPDRKFFYSGDGLGIKGAKNCSLEKIAAKYFAFEQDLKKIFLEKNESSKRVFDCPEKIKHLISCLDDFMEKITVIIDKLEHTYLEALILIHELKEDENYEFLLAPLFYQWKWRSLEPLKGNEKKEKYIFILQQLKRLQKEITSLIHQK